MPLSRPGLTVRQRLWESHLGASISRRNRSYGSGLRGFFENLERHLTIVLVLRSPDDRIPTSSEFVTESPGADLVSGPVVVSHLSVVDPSSQGLKVARRQGAQERPGPASRTIGRVPARMREDRAGARNARAPVPVAVVPPAAPLHRRNRTCKRTPPVAPSRTGRKGRDRTDERGAGGCPSVTGEA